MSSAYRHSERQDGNRSLTNGLLMVVIGLLLAILVASQVNVSSWFDPVPTPAKDCHPFTYYPDHARW